MQITVLVPVLLLAGLVGYSVGIPYHGGPAKTLPALDGTVYVRVRDVVCAVRVLVRDAYVYTVFHLGLQICNSNPFLVTHS